MDITKPLHFDEHGIVQFGPMRIGFVAPDSISLRRENPRRMSDLELQALRKSIDSMGFKSFILVEEITAGRYAVVDGHHRLKVLVEKKAAKIPVILIDEGTEQGVVDLAMLTFNVTGSANGSVYVDFIKELVDKHGVDIVSEHIAVEAGLLEDMTSTINDLMDQINAGEESGAMGQHFGGTQFVGRPLRIDLANTPENQALLAAARKKSGEATDAGAVMAALTEFVKEEP